MNKKQKRNRFDWDNREYRGNYGPGGQRRGDSRGSEQNRGSWQRNQNQGNRDNRNNLQSRQRQGNRPRQQPVQNQEIVLPYNFVPLNDKVIEAESYPGEKIEIENNKYKKYPLNKYHRGLYTGWIDLEITNKTPLYIRDTLTSDEISKKHEKEKKNERYINSDFFSPGGKIKIPGSSLRGMIRTLVEIVTFGKFVNFDGEKKYFYRALGDKSLRLRDFYKNKMIAEVNNSGVDYYGMKCSAGYLYKNNGTYYIKPAQSKVINGYNISVFKIDLHEIPNSVVFDEYDETYKISQRNVYFQYKEDLFWNHRGGSLHLFYAKVNDISPSNISGYLEGQIVWSGLFGSKKHFQHIILPPHESNTRQIPEEVIKDYKNDPFRRAVNLVKLADDNVGKKFPCFYIEENGQIIAFGHTPYFRIPYKYRVKDLVPNNLIDPTKIDIATAIFGNETDFAGRVFFEDAELVNEQADKCMTDIVIPKILAEPKPTAFQHYLEQGNFNDVRGNYTNLKDYNSDGKLRGYKLYWHKKKELLDDNWQEMIIDDEKVVESIFKIKENGVEELIIREHDRGGEKIKINIQKLNSLPDENELKKQILEMIRKYDTQHTMIKALLPGNQFIGRIRFENLANIELGALLFVLDLPQNCCHKIGMGKPLGLGSIEIKPKLHISDRLERYKSLEKEWIEKEFIEVSEVKKAEKEINQILNKFKEAFARFILEKLGVELGSATSTSGMPSTAGSAGAIDKLWEHQRMKELKSLLSYDPSPDASYPDVRVYQRRTAMKKASEINRV